MARSVAAHRMLPFCLAVVLAVGAAGCAGVPDETGSLSYAPEAGADEYDGSEAIDAEAIAEGEQDAPNPVGAQGGRKEQEGKSV